MNNHPYGVAKQLYRTSYSPSMDSSRASSLNNPNFSHIIHSQVPLLRPDSNTPVMFVRQLSKSNLSNSQNIQQDYKHKLATSDYYAEPIKEEFMKQIQQKIEELTRKVTKNSEDIKNMKKPNKSAANIEVSLTQEFQRINRRQQTLHQECLGKINSLRDQIVQSAIKLQKIQTQGWQKISLRFQEKHMIKIRNLIEDRVKQETTKIKLIIENQTNKISHQLRWELRRDNGTSPIKSLLKYPFKSTKIIFSEFLQTPKKGKEGSRLSTKDSESPRSGKVLMSNQRTYYVDRQGYLLDENNYYILDEGEQMIRLNSNMLQALRRQGLLKE